MPDTTHGGSPQLILEDDGSSVGVLENALGGHTSVSLESQRALGMGSSTGSLAGEWCGRGTRRGEKGGLLCHVFLGVSSMWVVRYCLCVAPVPSPLSLSLGL